MYESGESSTKLASNDNKKEGRLERAALGLLSQFRIPTYESVKANPQNLCCNCDYPGRVIANR